VQFSGPLECHHLVVYSDGTLSRDETISSRKDKYIQLSAFVWLLPLKATKHLESWTVVPFDSRQQARVRTLALGAGQN
jgi:hypothetical protein